MDHILAVLRIPAERASGFIALGEMAGALDGELIHYLPTIMSHLRDAVCCDRPFLVFLHINLDSFVSSSHCLYFLIGVLIDCSS